MARIELIVDTILWPCTKKDLIRGREDGWGGVLPIKPSWPMLKGSYRSGSFVSVLACPCGLKPEGLRVLEVSVGVKRCGSRFTYPKKLLGIS